MAAETVTATYQGSEYSFVGIQKDIIEDLNCAICHDLVCEPYQTSCGHLFCKVCFDRRAKNEQSVCPLCRAKCTTTNDSYNNRRVRNLKIICSNFIKGCQWKGDLSDIPNHLTKCRFEIKNCPLCDVPIKLENLDDHTKQRCPNRPIFCEYCNDNIGPYFSARQRLSAHYPECRALKVPCLHRCGAKYKFSDMVQHIDQSCPRVPIPCIYSRYGCKVSLERAKMETHQNEDHKHVFLATVLQLTEICIGLRAQATAAPFYPMEATIRPWLQNKRVLAAAPWVFRMNFKEKYEKEENWYSPSFYAFGYKLCLKVDPCGSGVNRSYVSLFICIMRGEYDTFLKWPFKAAIGASILNQISNKDHYVQDLWDGKKCLHNANQLIADKGRRSMGFGDARFIHLKYLLNPTQPKDRQIMYQGDNGDIYIRIDHVDRI